MVMINKTYKLSVHCHRHETNGYDINRGAG